jgi:hypothetical protein
VPAVGNKHLLAQRRQAEGGDTTAEGLYTLTPPSGGLGLRVPGAFIAQRIQIDHIHGIRILEFGGSVTPELCA